MKVQMVVTHIPTDREVTHDEYAPLAYRRPLETRTRVRAVTLLAEHSTTLKAGTEARLSTLNVLLRGDVARVPAAIASA